MTVSSRHGELLALNPQLLHIWKEVQRAQEQETMIRNWIFLQPTNPTMHEINLKK
jgi:hypothetical protein